MKKSFIGVSLLLVGLVLPVSVSASHSWGGYHWARTVNPFSLKLGSSLSSVWKSYLDTTSVDWSISTVLDTVVVPGQARRSCQPTSGRVEVCNKTYGKNGWLGIAQIWTNGLHIIQGIVKVNDTYFNTAKYNVPAWKNLVMCQEVGHTLGLDHQDEDFANTSLGTCMDYSNDPLPNQHPNQHDYDELSLIYGHLDNLTTVGQTSLLKTKGDFERQNEWGKQVKVKGKTAIFERDFGGGHKLFTFVIFSD